jgi:hypothetical protein
MLQFLPDSVSPKQPEPAAAEASPSPAAQALQSKGAGPKAAREKGRFAGSLEKALGAKDRKKNENVEGRSASGPAWTQKARVEVFRRLEELFDELFGGLFGQLFGRLTEQQILRLAARIDPRELLSRAESLGLDERVLKRLLVPAAGVPSNATQTAAEAISGEDRPSGQRGRLLDLLKRLVELLDSDGSLARLAEGSADKRPAPAGSERKLVDAVPVNSRKVEEPLKTGPKPRMVVLDLRKSPPENEQARERPLEAKSTVFRVGEKNAPAEGQDRDISILVRTHSQERGTTPAAEAAARSGRPAANFEQRFIPEVVKQTGIVLKNGGVGEIRLVLKPENLGSLRIRLSVSESSLEGRIVVDNNSVKELVESSLDNLKNALRLEGYQTANLEFEKVVPLFLEMNPDYEVVNVFA